MTRGEISPSQGSQQNLPNRQVGYQPPEINTAPGNETDIRPAEFQEPVIAQPMVMQQPMVIPQPMMVPQFQQQQPQAEAAPPQPASQDGAPGPIDPPTPYLRRSTRPTRGQTTRYKDYVQHLGPPHVAPYLPQYVYPQPLSYMNNSYEADQQSVYWSHYQQPQVPQPMMIHQPGILQPRHCSDCHKKAVMEVENNQWSVTYGR